MSNITITTHKGETLHSFIINEDGNPKGFATPFKDGSYYGLAFFESGDEKVSYTKCNDGFIYAIRPAVSRKTGKPFNWEIFVEQELFDLIKPKNWQENASLAACLDSESRVERLFKAVKADKTGNIWTALKGLKNDAERLAQLTEWCDDKWLAKMEKAYGLNGSGLKRPETAGVKRPDSK